MLFVAAEARVAMLVTNDWLLTHTDNCISLIYSILCPYLNGETREVVMTKTGERILIGVSVTLLIALYVSQAVWGGAKHDFGAVTAVDVEKSEQ